MLDDNLQQIEQFHSEWSKTDLTGKIGILMNRQRELNGWANCLANSRMLRGYFTSEEKAAVRLLQDIQNDLDQHKAEVNQDIYKEISKALLSAIVNR